MTRLIDADALDVLTVIGGRMNGKVEFAKAVNEMIQNAPTIDAVPVIQCKDCKHRYTDRGMGFCEKLDNMYYLFNDNDPIDADFYCKWAERKEDGK